MFDHMWKQVKEKFYDPELHGVDWNYYKETYSQFLPYINNNFDFQELLSEILGELNASHTGGRYQYRSGLNMAGSEYSMTKIMRVTDLRSKRFSLTEHSPSPILRLRKVTSSQALTEKKSRQAKTGTSSLQERQARRLR